MICIGKLVIEFIIRRNIDIIVFWLYRTSYWIGSIEKLFELNTMYTIRPRKNRKFYRTSLFLRG